MKAIYLHIVGAIAVSVTLAACVPSASRPAPAPPPPTVVRPAPQPAPPLVVQEPVFENYLDAPRTPGTWSYVDEPGEKLALYGTGSGEPLFMLRCAAGQIALARSTAALTAVPRAMSISTETTTRQMQANPVQNRPFVAASLTVSDPLLDAMAITKGRFAVEVEGESTLYLPAWVEVSRVIEDCR